MNKIDTSQMKVGQTPMTVYYEMLADAVNGIAEKLEKIDRQLQQLSEGVE